MNFKRNGPPLPASGGVSFCNPSRNSLAVRSLFQTEGC